MTQLTQETPTVDAAGRPLPERDIRRLQKPPYKTRYKPSNPETVNALRGWTPPKHAYVLFERWKIELLSEGERIITHGAFVFNVEGRPDQTPKIEFYVRKGFRILDWGNFHYLTDANKESAKLAAMYDSAWAKLEADLLHIANTTDIRAENKELREEKDALLAKIAEYEAKLASKGTERAQRVEKPAEEKK